jgi:hypothetical protein
MKKLLLLPLSCLLAACVSAVKVDSGERAIGERLAFNIDGAWNQINAPGIGPAQVWTMEGLPIDQLLVYSGIKDGEAISSSGTSVASNTSGTSRKTFNFRSSMQSSHCSKACSRATAPRSSSIDWSRRHSAAARAFTSTIVLRERSTTCTSPVSAMGQLTGVSCLQSFILRRG